MKAGELPMADQCWKCHSPLASRRVRFCSACGILYPRDGNRRFQKTQAKLQRVQRLILLCGIRTDRHISLSTLASALLALTATLRLFYGIVENDTPGYGLGRAVAIFGGMAEDWP